MWGRKVITLTIRKAISVLHKLANKSPDALDTVVCQVLWLREDIEWCETQTEGMKPLTDDERDDILNLVEIDHDAYMGITFPTLEWEVCQKQKPLTTETEP